MAALGEPMGLDALELAASIVEIANENMASAIKMVSLERGHDPRRFSLLAFGGAGPLHAAAVARVLGVPKVIVPQYPGVFSALGLLLADIRVDKVWTQAFRSNDVDAALVNRQFNQITERAIGELRQEGYAGEPEVRRAINMRYFGQNYEHEVEIESGELDEAALQLAFRRFDALHEERYGYAIDGEVIELVSFKVTAIGRRPRLELSGDDRGERIPALGSPGLRAWQRLRRGSSRPSVVTRGGRAAIRARRDRRGRLDPLRRARHGRRAELAGRAPDRDGGGRVNAPVIDQVALTVVDNYLTSCLPRYGRHDDDDRVLADLQRVARLLVRHLRSGGQHACPGGVLPVADRHDQVHRRLDDRGARPRRLRGG